ncbi:DUF5753 domain-containing protein [Spirillospora sp. NBC_00431]
MPAEQKQIIDAFSRDLYDAYQKSGIASYRELSKRLDTVSNETAPGRHRITTLCMSTAWEILQGNRKKIPAWDKVSLLIQVFHTAAAERNIDPARVGTLAEWKDKHEAAAAAFHAAKPASPRSPMMTVADAGDSPVPADGAQAWWSGYSDIVPAWLERYLNHEPLSDLIFSYEPLYVPGLLQTPEYAAEVFRLEYDHEPRERLARRVNLRTHRQRHLSRRDWGRPSMWAILNEGALRSGLISAATMRAQIRHLLLLGPHVRIQVIPVSHPAHDSADGPITILRFGSLQLPDLVYLEHADNGLYPSDEEDRAYYLHAINKLGLAALKPDPSRVLLRRIEAEI